MTINQKNKREMKFLQVKVGLHIVADYLSDSIFQHVYIILHLTHKSYY